MISDRTLKQGSRRTFDSRYAKNIITTWNKFPEWSNIVQISRRQVISAVSHLFNSMTIRNMSSYVMWPDIYQVICRNPNNAVSLQMYYTFSICAIFIQISFWHLISVCTCVSVSISWITFVRVRKRCSIRFTCTTPFYPTDVVFRNFDKSLVNFSESPFTLDLKL